MEEKYRFAHLTPYEKNIEIWKQLWMVIERSDILVQIVDCRDPLFFRCEDLESYVKEVGEQKVNFLLLNKADLLDDEMRKYWSEYLNSKNIQHIFFSAKNQQHNIDKDIIEGDVPDNLEGLVNTSAIVDRNTLKSILKKIVSDYKKTQVHHAPAKLEEKKLEEKIETPVPTNEAKIEKELPQKPVEEIKKEPIKAPTTSKIKILKVVTDEEIKDKPVVNLWEAIQKKEGTFEECDEDCDHDHDDDSEECDHEKSKEGEMSEKPGKDHPKKIDEEDDSEGDEEDNEDNEDKEKVPEPEKDIYTKLGVDRHHLVSKPFYDKKDENNIVIGMIGFPNVGKSSVINVLCNKKLVGVGSRPGKTKNFQTIVLETNLILCDCPGLVFPSIVHSKAHMVIED